MDERHFAKRKQSDSTAEEGFPGGSDGKESTCNVETQSSPWVGKVPWRREGQPTPVFLPGEFHGQRSPVGYSPWGHKESDMTEQLTLPLFHSSGQ